MEPVGIEAGRLSLALPTGMGSKPLEPRQEQPSLPKKA